MISVENVNYNDTWEYGAVGYFCIECNKRIKVICGCHNDIDIVYKKDGKGAGMYCVNKDCKTEQHARNVIIVNIKTGEWKNEL